MLGQSTVWEERRTYTRRGRMYISRKNIWASPFPVSISITACLLSPENTVLAWRLWVTLPAYLKISLPCKKKQKPRALSQSTMNITVQLEKRHSMHETLLHLWPTVQPFSCSFGVAPGGKEKKQAETGSVWRTLHKWSTSEVAMPLVTTSTVQFLFCGLSV